MLSHLGANGIDVVNELAKRFDMSGLEEKASRK
jgi:phosphoribosyl-ATP pyrophosphohydrolase